MPYWKPVLTGSAIAMIQEIAFGSVLYDLTLAFRHAHLRKPLGLPQSPADLKGEDHQIHIAAIENGGVQGTVLLKPLSTSRIKLRQMAVAPEMRGVGLGADLVRFAEGIAVGLGHREIEMSARASARGFYEKLGYRVVGDPFIEVTVPHFKMVREISI